MDVTKRIAVPTYANQFSQVLGTECAANAKRTFVEGIAMLAVTLSSALVSRVEHYAQSHRAPVNKLLHYVGIPAITIAMMGLLARLSFPWDSTHSVWHPNGAWIAIFIAGAWYMWLDLRIGSITTVGLVTCYLIGANSSIMALLALAVVGIAAHLIGHRYFEGKPPALLSHPIAVLEAPLWFFATWLGVHP